MIAAIPIAHSTACNGLNMARIYASTRHCVNLSMRIVSLVPSWTEYLIDLGLGNDIKGRTKFCVRAGDESDRIAVIGGTKNFHVEQIEHLNPDLIISSKEENDKTLVEACGNFADVLLTDVKTIPNALEACKEIALATKKQKAGQHWVDQIQKTWGEPKTLLSKADYVVWKKPLMLAGPDTFIHAVMEWWGIKNSIQDLHGSRYPEISEADWNQQSTDWTLLPSEPFPFQTKHLASFQEMGKNPLLVDGEAFSWYGSRMAHVAPYLEKLAQELRA